MKTHTLIIFFFFLTVYISCSIEPDSVDITGTWQLEHSQREPIHFHGLDDSIISNQTTLQFKSDNSVVVKNLKSKKTCVLEYELVQDTIVPIIIDLKRYVKDRTSLVYIGKETKIWYRIKKLSEDKLLLLSNYKKYKQEDLPLPNEFGNQQDFKDYIKEYEILLERE